MKNENPDFPDALDQALRAHLKPPAPSATFRAQVWQRIAAERAANARTTAPIANVTLRVRFVLKCANIGAAGIAAALVCWAAWPSVRLPAIPESVAVSVFLAISGSILLVGAQRLGLFRGLREFGA